MGQLQYCTPLPCAHSALSHPDPWYSITAYSGFSLLLTINDSQCQFASKLKASFLFNFVNVLVKYCYPAPLFLLHFNSVFLDDMRPQHPLNSKRSFGCLRLRVHTPTNKVLSVAIAYWDATNPEAKRRSDDAHY